MVKKILLDFLVIFQSDFHVNRPKKNLHRIALKIKQISNF